MTPKRTKAGTSRVAAAARRAAFKAAYLANGHNATQAAITAGYSAKTAASQGQRLLRDVETSRELAEAAREVGDAAGLEAKRELREAGRLSRSDVRRLFRADGTLKDPHEWDDDTAAAIASIEVIEQFEGTSEDRKLSGYSKKGQNSAKQTPRFEKTIKHLDYTRKTTPKRGRACRSK